MGVSAAPRRDLATTYAATATDVLAADHVVAVGSRTHAEIGGPVTRAVDVAVAGGIVALEPADLTITAAAGTTVRELEAALAEHRQGCPLDPRDPNATIGGTLAAGLSGVRRLGLGPLRDTLLEVVVVLADGRVVRGGGPTVKNVTGYDLPRLLVGSLGTLGVLVEVTLRTRPQPAAAGWFRAPDDTPDLLHRLVAPVAILKTMAGDYVRLEGDPADLAAECRTLGLEATDAPPLPDGPHRGRISVPPGRLGRTVESLTGRSGLRSVGEVGVGTVHVATDDEATLAWARTTAETHGGWMLREAGAPGLDPFGREVAASDLQRRIRTALDPTGKLAPGRVSATEPR